MTAVQKKKGLRNHRRPFFGNLISVATGCHGGSVGYAFLDACGRHVYGFVGDCCSGPDDGGLIYDGPNTYGFGGDVLYARPIPGKDDWDSIPSNMERAGNCCTNRVTQPDDFHKRRNRIHFLPSLF